MGGRKKSNRKTKAKAQAKAKAIKISKKKKKSSKAIFKKSELLRYKNLLIKIKNSLMDEIERIAKGTLRTSQRDASGDLSGYTFHIADMASDNYDREFSLGIATNEQRTIFEIDEALKRIEEGIYGICTSCEKAISKRRLAAIPYARYCIKCQEEEELIQKKGL